MNARHVQRRGRPDLVVMEDCFRMDERQNCELLHGISKVECRAEQGLIRGTVIERM